MHNFSGFSPLWNASKNKGINVPTCHIGIMVCRCRRCSRAVRVWEVPCRGVKATRTLECRSSGVIVTTGRRRPVALHGASGQSARGCPVRCTGRLRETGWVGRRGAIVVCRGSWKTGLSRGETGLWGVLLPIGCCAGGSGQVVKTESGLELVWSVQICRVAWSLVVVVVML